MGKNFYFGGNADAAADKPHPEVRLIEPFCKF